MDQAEQHLTADSILERAQKIDPRVHRVTVYRTLEMLKSHGLLDELDLLHIHGHRHYYESHGPRDHIHVACLRCGKVREVESELFEQLKRQVRARHRHRHHRRARRDRRLLRRLPGESERGRFVALIFSPIVSGKPQGPAKPRALGYNEKQIPRRRAPRDDSAIVT